MSLYYWELLLESFRQILIIYHSCIHRRKNITKTHNWGIPKTLYSQSSSFFGHIWTQSYWCTCHFPTWSFSMSSRVLRINHLKTTKTKAGQSIVACDDILQDSIWAVTSPVIHISFIHIKFTPCCFISIPFRLHSNILSRYLITV